MGAFTNSVPVRFTVVQHEALKMLAEAGDFSVSDVVRAAVDAYVAARRNDPEFRRGVEMQIARLQRVLEVEK